MLRKQSEPVFPRSDLRDSEQTLKDEDNLTFGQSEGGNNIMALTIFSKQGKTEK